MNVRCLELNWIVFQVTLCLFWLLSPWLRCGQDRKGKVISHLVSGLRRFRRHADWKSHHEVWISTNTSTGATARVRVRIPTVAPTVLLLLRTTTRAKRSLIAFRVTIFHDSLNSAIKSKPHRTSLLYWPFRFSILETSRQQPRFFCCAFEATNCTICTGSNGLWCFSETEKAKNSTLAKKM